MYCVRLSDGTNWQCWFVQSCLYDMLSYNKLMFWRIVPWSSKLWELCTGRHSQKSQTTCLFSNTAVTASSMSHTLRYIPVQLSGCSLHMNVGTNNIVSNYVYLSLTAGPLNCLTQHTELEANMTTHRQGSLKCYHAHNTWGFFPRPLYSII